MPNSSFFSTVSNKTGNSTDLDIQFDSNFAFLMFSLILAMTWVLYITYYNSRVVGYFITRLLTRFYVKKGYLSIGSFTVCALSGMLFQLFNLIFFLQKIVSDTSFNTQLEKLQHLPTAGLIHCWQHLHLDRKCGPCPEQIIKIYCVDRYYTL